MKRVTLSIAGALAAVVVAAPVAASPTTTYHVAQRYTLGGDGGWDYVILDTTGNRLFIGRQNRVMVVDEASGKLLGEIAGLSAAHGTALDEATGHAFATSGRDSSVVMFDLK